MSAPRRTRPSNRKELILAAAAGRFRDQGFHDVGMADIAEAVGIGPSALYRHYRGKQELLVAVLDGGLTAFEEAIGGAGDWHDCVRRAAEVAFDDRAFGRMWDRDRGVLSTGERAAFRERINGMAGALAARLPQAPGVTDPQRSTIAFAVLALLWLPARRAPGLPVSEQRRALICVAEAMVTDGLDRLAARAQLPRPQEGEGARPAERPALPVSRREALLIVATDQFARYGFPNVGLEDIGQAAGIAGPSVYNYFDTKVDIVVRILSRAADALWLDLDRVLHLSPDPVAALDGVVTGYVEFATGHPALMRVVTAQPGNLPEPAQQVVDQRSREYAKEWVALVSQVRPDLPDRHVAFVVRCAIDVINGTNYLHRIRGDAVTADIVDLARAVLAVTFGGQ